MAVTKAQKSEILKGLVEKFGKSKSVVFAEYRGIDVSGLTSLRKELRGVKSEMKVAKKTLMDIAAKENKVEGLEASHMEGPVAATFSYDDPLSGIKVIFKFSKTNDKLKILGGIIDGKVVSADIVKQYAKLPSREELLAKFMGSAQSPVSGFVGVLSNLMSGFVRVINAYKDKMPK
jgi:large subunit ribosomal protein L10